MLKSLGKQVIGLTIEELLGLVELEYLMAMKIAFEEKGDAFNSVHYSALLNEASKNVKPMAIVGCEVLRVYRRGIRREAGKMSEVLKSTLGVSASKQGSTINCKRVEMDIDALSLLVDVQIELYKTKGVSTSKDAISTNSAVDQCCRDLDDYRTQLASQTCGGRFRG